jgi:iron complex transport system permease protein
VRLPRACTALCAGSALGCAGLVLQTLFRNPLADPTVLGVSSGAGLGVAFAVLGGSAVGIPLVGRDGPFARLGIVAAAMLGAAAVLVLVLAVARRVGHRSTVLIVGLMTGFALSSVVSVLVSLSTNEQLRSFVVWGQGSFRGTSWGDVAVLATSVLICAVGLVWLAKPLDALLLGDHAAASLGVDVRRVRVGVVAVAAVLTATVTAFCGPIAFLGIAVPHLTRGMMRQARHRVVLPATALCGAFVALVCEIVAQLPGSERVLPLNAITALLGAPVVVWVLIRRRPMDHS